MKKKKKTKENKKYKTILTDRQTDMRRRSCYSYNVLKVEVH